MLSPSSYAITKPCQPEPLNVNPFHPNSQCLRQVCTTTPGCSHFAPQTFQNGQFPPLETVLQLCCLRDEVSNPHPGKLSLQRALSIPSPALSLTISTEYNCNTELLWSAPTPLPPPIPVLSLICLLLQMSILCSNGLPPSLHLATSIYPLALDSGSSSIRNKAFSDILFPPISFPCSDMH